MLINIRTTRHGKRYILNIHKSKETLKAHGSANILFAELGVYVYRWLLSLLV